MPPSAHLLALLIVFFFFFFFFPPLSSASQMCSEGFLGEISKFNVTGSCQRKTLGTEFAFNFNNANRRLDVALGARLVGSDKAWVAWGLNPQGARMVGTRALIGIRNADKRLESGKYSITDGTKLGCPLTPSDDIGLDVRNFTFRYLPDIDYHVILATVILPKDYNQSRTHVVWQIGFAAPTDGHLTHPKSLEHLDSTETVDLNTDIVSGYKIVLRRRLRTAHGVVNILGWGILLPVGVIIARYLKKFPKRWNWWFVVHVSCQTTGYILGSIGWSIGLFLGELSKNYSFPTHRIMGIVIFTFTTIQMMALKLKPKQWDDYRPYWNMYHHSLGYALLALMAANIFQGIKIIGAWQPHQPWKWGYIAVLGVLGGVALVLEVYTWYRFLDLGKNNSTGKSNPQRPGPGTVQPQPDERNEQ